ncbi:hypothetical protein RB195_000286 [Necator americanus]|uniref:Uncharacterized protein n=1 Tax=Necator americanus TaxID=51031 RepID=A0ABR1D8W9_NECAM
MKDVDIWNIPIFQLTNLTLILIFLVFIVLCILSAICRRRKAIEDLSSNRSTPQYDNEQLGTQLAEPLSSLQASCHYNHSFDYNEICASRIEERRCEREARLQCENPSADVTLDRIDRSIGAALAVEKLLRDSYIFDTRVMSRPSGDVLVVAAKRDYI